MREDEYAIGEPIGFLIAPRIAIKMYYVPPRVVPNLTLVEIARAVARTAHCGQVDKLGRDYFTHHVEPVAEAVARAGARGGRLHAAAYLHDVLEDCGGDDGYTADTLRVAGISEKVIEIVEVLTRRPDETYAAYIDRVSCHREARVVKLADNGVNRDNLPLLQAINVLEAHRLGRRYAAAATVLMDAMAVDC